VARRGTDVDVHGNARRRRVTVGHALPLQVDRAFLVEALYAACDYFGRLAEESSDAQIREEYDIKRARCVRLVVNL
jgi:hypothetical protein